MRTAISQSPQTLRKRDPGSDSYHRYVNLTCCTKVKKPKFADAKCKVLLYHV